MIASSTPAFCPVQKTWPSFLPSGDQVTLHGMVMDPLHDLREQTRAAMSGHRRFATLAGVDFLGVLLLQLRDRAQT